MYGNNVAVNQQLQYMQMNAMMNGGMGMGMGMTPGFFVCSGNAISVEGRLDNITDQQLSGIQQATITITGTQIQAMNNVSLMCTAIWGGIIIIPIFFMCCDWWKRCTFPAFSIPVSTYMKLSRIFRAPNLNNVTLTIIDNTFNAEKAMILYNLLAESRIKGFTFINGAGNYDFFQRQSSDFVKNMRPIKQLTHVISDIRWGTDLVMY